MVTAMANLKIPEELETRVLEFYNEVNENSQNDKYVHNEDFYRALNMNLSDAIKVY